MNLLYQVDVLRHNLSQMQSTNNLVLPMNPDYVTTRNAYRFANLVHPARDIMKKIKKADPGGSVLPKNLRGWRVQVRDGFGNDIEVELVRILNSIIHLQYFLLDDQVLDVENDNSNERYIVNRHVLFAGINRLLLEFKDICLVACSIAERGYKNALNVSESTQEQEWEYMPFGPWYRDLWAILANIHYHPRLVGLVWRTYFAGHATPLGSRDVANHMPFTMRIWPTVWKIGWRRDGLYSIARVKVSDLIKTIRYYIRTCSAVRYR